MAKGIYDIHRNEEKWKTSLESFKEGDSVNKKLILEFLRDYEIGKVKRKNSAKKKPALASLIKILYTLKTLSKLFQKDFRKIKQKDLEQWSLDLDNNKFRSIAKLGDSVKVDFKVCFRMFARHVGLELDTEFFDTSIARKDFDIIDKEELDKLINALPSYYNSEARGAYKFGEVKSDHFIKRGALILKILFDSGMRSEEALNILWNDLKWNDKEKCYFLTIREETSKTVGRTISLPLSTKEINDWIVQCKKVGDYGKNKKIFDMQYNAFRMFIERVTGKILEKRMPPKIFRKSSATFYASKLNYSQLCIRFGWRFGSDIPNVYIKRSGVSQIEAIKSVRTDKIDKLEGDVQELFSRLDEVFIPLLKDREWKELTEKKMKEKKLLNEFLKI